MNIVDETDQEADKSTDNNKDIRDRSDFKVE